MSDIGKAVRTYLLTKSGVTTLVNQRIYPDVLPQNAKLPAVVFFVVSNHPEHHMGGGSTLTQARVQVDCYASTRLGANALGEAIRNAMDGTTGTFGAQFAQTCHLDMRQYFYDPPEDKSDVGRYGETQDWLIAVTETAPTG